MLKDLNIMCSKAPSCCCPLKMRQILFLSLLTGLKKSAGGIGVGSAQQILIEKGYRIFYFNDVSKMKKVNGILKEGYFMLFATKREIEN